MKRLTNQVALVTGAGSGIGKAIALALGAEGASLILVGRRRAPLDEVVAALAAGGTTAAAFPTDLEDRAGIRHLAEAVTRDFSTLDLLVHCAGTVRTGDVAEASVDDFELLFRTNVIAPFLLTQLMLPLLEQQAGQVVFINSSAGLTAKAHVAQYSASKHALRAVADSLRAEVNTAGVRVLSVFPGRTATPTQERLHAEERRPYIPQQLLQPEDVAAAVINALCLTRTAEVTDVHIRPMLKFD